MQEEKRLELGKPHRLMPVGKVATRYTVIKARRGNLDTEPYRRLKSDKEHLSGNEVIPWQGKHAGYLFCVIPGNEGHTSREVRGVPGDRCSYCGAPLAPPISLRGTIGKRFSAGRRFEPVQVVCGKVLRLFQHPACSTLSLEAIVTDIISLHEAATNLAHNSNPTLTYTERPIMVKV
jgi:hypothetical protein